MNELSIIIPAYNEEAYIGTCLEHAIAHADGLVHEIIVVDNASTDRTAEIASSYTDRGVRVISESRKGPMWAREAGFRASTGSVVAFIDADTRMPPHWVRTVLNEFARSERTVCVSGPYEYYDKSRIFSAGTRLFWFGAYPLYLLTGYMAIGGNLAIRRDTLERMHGFDTTIAFYGDDTDTARRAREFGEVKFLMSLRMPTSPRRFAGQGLGKTLYLYTKNFFSQVVHKRSATKDYIDIR